MGTGWQVLSMIFLLLTGLMVASPCLADAAEDFFKSARMDNSSEMQSLLRRGINPNLVEPARGESALMMAARDGSMKVLPLLLNARGINLNLRAKNGDTALMLAAFKKRKAVVEMLLAKGAAVNQDGWTALHYAAVAGDAEIVQLLLKRSAEVDSLSPNMTTPLMMAAMSGNIYAVKALLDGGADLNMANEQGLTAIDFAQKGNHTEIVEGLQYRKKANERRAAEAIEAEERRARPLEIETLRPPMD